MSTLTITPVALRADQFAAGWTNVARAENTNPDDPFHRTVIVEVYERRGVRLVATNGYLMLWTWLPIAQDMGDDELPEPEPELTERPDVALWVKDRDHLIHGACKVVARQAKGHANQRVVLSVGIMEDDAQPTLDPELDRIGLILAARDQRELAPLMVGHSLPEWRAALEEFDPATVDVTAYSIDSLKRIGGLNNELGYVRLTHQGDGKPVLLHADTTPPVDGLLVPIRLNAAVPDAETSWADDAIARINEVEGYVANGDDDFDAMLRLAEQDAQAALDADEDDEDDEDDE